MAWTPQPSPEEPGPAPRPMTRCECTGIAFQEIARRIREEGLSIEEVSRGTGCGRTCTACLPDLTRYLSSL